MRKSENILSEKQLPAITKRIKQLVEHYAGGSVKLFSEQISLASSQKLNRVFNIDKRNNEYPEVSSDILIAIANMYSLVDINWILTGRGSMLRTDSTQPVEPTSASASSDAVVLRLMDKLDDKETENKQLQSELRTMEKELVALKTIRSQFQDKESEHKSRISEAVEAFTLESSGGSGGDFLPTKPPTTSKGLSAGKM